jgi:hypothetical protein
MNRAILCAVIASSLLALPRRVSGASDPTPTEQQQPVKCGTTSDFHQLAYDVPFSRWYDDQGHPSYIPPPYGPDGELDQVLYDRFPGGCDACPEQEEDRCYASMIYWGSETYVDTTRIPGGYITHHLFNGKYWLECYSCDWYDG